MELRARRPLPAPAATARDWVRIVAPLLAVATAVVLWVSRDATPAVGASAPLTTLPVADGAPAWLGESFAGSDSLIATASQAGDLTTYCYTRHDESGATRLAETCVTTIEGSRDLPAVREGFGRTTIVGEQGTTIVIDSSDAELLRVAATALQAAPFAR